MKKVLKWLGIILGSLIGLLLLVLVVVYVMSEAHLNKVYQVDPPAVTIPTDATAIAEGERLFATRGCMDCHKANGAGGVFIDDPLLGRVSASNLTAGQNGIGGSYQANDWVRAIRHGLDPEGKPLWIMPAQEFNGINDTDLGALIAYIKSLPPVDSTVAKNRLGPLGRVLLLASKQVTVLPVEVIDHTAPRPVAIEPGVTEAYGAYLAQTCVGCHGAGLSGGAIPGVPAEPPYPANLTPDPATGLGSWTQADFVRAIRQGQRPNGPDLDPTAMPWPNFARMNDTELSALWVYLQSVPAKPEGQR